MRSVREEVQLAVPGDTSAVGASVLARARKVRRTESTAASKHMEVPAPHRTPDTARAPAGRVSPPRSSVSSKTPASAQQKIASAVLPGLAPHSVPRQLSHPSLHAVGSAELLRMVRRRPALASRPQAVEASARGATGRSVPTHPLAVAHAPQQCASVPAGPDRASGSIDASQSKFFCGAIGGVRGVG